MNDRALRLARRAALWIIGPVFLLVRGPLAELTPAARCGGALELVSILIVRALPELGAGVLFTAVHAATITIAFGCFAELAYRASGSVLIAAVLTTTLGISHPFGATFSLPWTAALFGACAAVALALYDFVQPTAASAGARSAMGSQVALLAAAAIVPAWTVPCVLLVFAVTWRSSVTEPPSTRAATATAASILLAIISMGVARTVNATWTACVWPADIFSSVNAVGPVVDACGPLVLALGALGAYETAVSGGVTRRSVGAGVAALATLSLLEAGVANPVPVVPALVAVWYLAAAGMREMRNLALNRRVFASALLFAALPLLQLSRSRLVAVEREGFSRAGQLDGVSRARLLGHDRVSLAQIRRLLNLVPDRATIVEDDASVELLVRAAAFGGRPAKTFTTVPASRRDVTDAMNAGQRVYAFPLGQRELTLRGFAIDAVTDPPGADSRGLAAVSATRPCVEIAKTWVDLDGVGLHGRVSLVADAASAVGPLVVYFSGENGYTPGPDGWPAELVPGFALQMFDRDTSSNAARMDAEAASAGLLNHPVFAAPYVARLTLSRVPRAALALPVVLGPPRAYGVGKLSAVSADASPLTLCDAPSGRLSEF